MKKSIEKTDAGYTIRTVNGVDTKSGAIWVREIKEYEPLENGFNLALANEVYELINTHQYLWDQDSWRRLLFTSDLDAEEKRELKSMLAFEADLTQPTCGTAMCFAGWVSELSGADYVSDAQMIEAAKSQSPYMEYILVRRDELNERWDTRAVTMDEYLGGQALARAQERGFSDETHKLMAIEDYALMKLGLVDGDWLELFSGSNDLEDIRSIIDDYADAGPARQSRDSEYVSF